MDKYLTNQIDKHVLNKLLICAQYSKIVYSEETVTENKDFTFCKNEKSNVEFLVKEDHKNKICYIVFRGTSSLTDWVHDLNVFKTQPAYINKKCKVHMGFNDGYISVRDLLCNYYNRKNEFDRFVFSGHSYGAALCTLAAFDCRHNFTDFACKVECITFGSPRVGNYAFKQLFDTYIHTSYRCVYKKDPVTVVPSYFRFRHVKNQLRCSNKPRYVYPNTVISSFLNLFFLKIKDHSMTNYIHSIKKEIDNI